MSWSVVSQALGSAASGANLSVTGAATGSGHLLVLCVASNAAGTTFGAVTDDAGNTWTPEAASGSSTQGRATRIYFCANANPVTSVTCVVAGSASNTFAGLYEFAGADLTNPEDATVGTFQPGTNNPAPVSLTASQSTDLIVAMIMANNNTSAQCTTTADWTRLTANGFAAVYKTNPAAGTVAGPSWTLVNAVGSGQSMSAYLAGNTAPSFSVSVWDGTTEQPASISFWNGTTEVSASVDSIT
jgi:hypothetical protein